MRGNKPGFSKQTGLLHLFVSAAHPNGQDQVSVGVLPVRFVPQEPRLPLQLRPRLVRKHVVLLLSSAPLDWTQHGAIRSCIPLRPLTDGHASRSNLNACGKMPHRGLLPRSSPCVVIVRRRSAGEWLLISSTSSWRPSPSTSVPQPAPDPRDSVHLSSYPRKAGHSASLTSSPARVRRTRPLVSSSKP